MVNTEIRLIIFFAAKDGEALYSYQKEDQQLTVTQIMSSLLPKSDLNWMKYGKPLDHSGIRSDQISHSVVSNSLRSHKSQHARPPCPSPAPRVHSNSCPSSQRCHPAISSSVIPFSSCPQSLPASESFPMSQLFAWGGQSTGVSALTSLLPKKPQGWSPSEWSKRLLISWLQSPSVVILEPRKIKSGTVSTDSPSISHEVVGQFRYDLNRIPYDYTVEMTNRFKGLDLIDGVWRTMGGGP